MKKTKLEEKNEIENLEISNEAISYAEPVKVKIELSETEKKVLHWKSKGQSADWISKALGLHTNKVNEIINANL